ncbi:MAG: hypothetical protein ABSA52_13250 [Candidatus Binatia bacterium]|jgi:hypothetical protein
MAQTEHLPIYKKAYDLCLYFEQVVRNFSRYHKPVLSSAQRVSKGTHWGRICGTGRATPSD